MTNNFLKKDLTLASSLFLAIALVVAILYFLNQRYDLLVNLFGLGS